MVGTGQRGGFVQDSVCGDFKSPNPYNPALQGASGMQLLGRTSWMARCTPKPWAAAWVLQPPYGPHVRGGPALSLGLARSIPEPPPCAWLTAGQPSGRLLSHCWLQPQHSPAGSTAGTCPQPLPAAGFAVLGGTYRPTTGEGTQLPLGLSCPQPVQIPERQCFVPSPPPRVVPSVPGPLVAGGKGRLVQPGVTVVRLSLPGVPCRCLRCIQGTTTGGEVEGQRRYKGNNGLRALVKLWVR